MLEPLELENIFARHECERIVSSACSGALKDAGLVGGVTAQNARRSRVFWLDETGRDAWIFQRLLECVARANREHFSFRLEEFAEKPQVAWYGAEPGGFFDWHVDVGDGAFARRRKLTTIVQLSDARTYDGGKLETNSDGHVRIASREIGTALLLPSFVLHRVSPIVRGERYSLVLWAHGPAFS